jgi:eukaryotic-like serine/threonine-protein kinase
VKRGVPCQRGDLACGEADAVSSKGESLSDAFVQESAKRFGLVGLTVAAGALFTLLAAQFAHHLFDVEPTAAETSILTARIALIVLSVGIYALSRSSICPRMLLNLGLAYQGLGALLICVTAYWGDALIGADERTLGWLAIWILLFPLVVPARPVKNIVCAVGSATLAPATYFLWTAVTDHPVAAPHLLLTAFLPYYACAGLAVVPATVLYHLGRSVTDAQREVKALGSYTLVEQLGAGGMGEVWRAEHRMLARPAAIKLIKKDILTVGNDGGNTTEVAKQVVARFEREAQATSALTSPHTISLFDFGVTDDGVFYYVMEMLDGIDLDTLIAHNGPVCPSRTIHLLVQACASLAEAHESGLIHRDVKPANIFCCQVGLTRDFVKLLDFGLVTRAAKAATPESLKLTGNSTIVGTPAFIAPEQVETLAVDPRADIYALGCVGYWLLTGRYVFEQESTLRMMLDHLNTKPEPASKRLGKPMPQDLEDVLMACLAKDPNDRPKSAELLATQLLACDVPRWTQDLARAWWSEHMDAAKRSHPKPDAGAVDPHASTLQAKVKI